MSIVQEFCDGGSLFDAMKDGRMLLQLHPEAAAAHPPGGRGPPAAADASLLPTPNAAATARTAVNLPAVLAVVSNIAEGCAYIHRYPGLNHLFSRPVSRPHDSALFPVVTVSD